MEEAAGTIENKLKNEHTNDETENIKDLINEAHPNTEVFFGHVLLKLLQLSFFSGFMAFRNLSSVCFLLVKWFFRSLF